MAKILKNTTGSIININDIGISIPTASEYIIQNQDYLLLSSSVDVETLINSGDIVVNDGLSDLSSTIGKEYIKYPDSAKSILFNNSVSQFSVDPKNVQDAIDASGEKAQVALDTPRYTLSLIYNGTVSNGTYIGYSNLVAGNDTPIIIPINSNLGEFTFSNANSSPSYRLEFIKNSIGNSPFYTVTKSSTKDFVDNTIDEDFNTGDSLFIRYIDLGLNASDVAIILLLKALP